MATPSLFISASQQEHGSAVPVEALAALYTAA